MHADALEGVLQFLRTAERLKTVTRSAWTSTGRAESVAEHSWRLCLMAMVVFGSADDLDVPRLLKMCLIHDLGEALGGDIPAPAQQSFPGKAEQERADLRRVIGSLPAAARDEIAGLWEEYEAASSPEAKAAKGLDKLETILQHTQGANPVDFDYGFNLGYGRRFTDADPRLIALRTRLDADTARRAEAGAR